ncbi:hypothetical protein BUPH_05280 [Paraburkholderia phenoliruptrix BR3459a]|uniref:Uncharacterized protein n=1 Tax=Paraburkholderia phenoliruptrix BR3459a TaxID=1229205 RepID=K0DMH7_9BURK|nr:hypothetical protein BUPH_05280 [Paraburkholderia phenoliruptrix BR3459a]
MVGAAGSAYSASQQADAAQSAADNANSPWSAARPFIAGEFQPATDALNNALKMGTNSTYDGERVAALNPYQTQGADSTAAYANGNGVNTANQFYNTGMGMTGAGSSFGTNAQGLLRNAQTDPTAGFLSTASQYANNPYVDQMIDAANTDVARQLNQQALPTLALNAAGSGNTNSTRTGVQSAILQSQAQQNMLNNASTIRGQMFNTGLNMAQTQHNTDATNALNANNQVGQAYSLGSTALLNGQQANGNNFDQLNAAGGLYQNQQQSLDNAAMNQFNEQQSTPLNLYGQYMNVINGKWGGQAVSSVGPSTAAAAAQGAVGGGMLGYGAYQRLGGYNNNSNGGSAAYGNSALFGASSGYDVPAATDYYSGAGNTYGFSVGGE